jgi:murein DD-endopeptidase MepM/ murein hydrolase activator NlpD
VSQAFGGSFSHSGPEKYAIDWTMPEATPVLAARAGVVVALKEDSTRGGPNRRFENDANFILIEHSDGTIANYAHLMHDGVRVKVGQRVTTGEFIGLSGNTGFSSGPHLHLSVFRPLDGKSRESIPIRFSVDGRAASLSEGQLCANTKTPLLTSVARRGARD